MREQVNKKEHENCDNDKRIKAADFDLFKLQERANELQKVAEMRDYELKKTNDCFDATHTDLVRARDESTRLQDE